MPIDKVRVMISSRCKNCTVADGTVFELERLRSLLKSRIDAESGFEQGIFECFINENEPAKAASRNLWDECLQEIQRSHIVAALYNGDAGWSGVEADDGICHAELFAALCSGRDRCFAIQLPLTAKTATARDARFKARFEQELHFTGKPTQTVEQALALVLQTLAQAVAKLSRGGAAVLRKESYSLGAALDWSRLPYAARKAAMEAACMAALTDRAAGPSLPASGTGQYAKVSIAGATVLFCVHAIPAATSLAAARELVGKPFLADHLNLMKAQRAHGPVHLIDCHRSATEKQATDLLGFTDATVVSTRFGIYVVDPVQRIQIVLLANCRDQATTRYAVRSLFDWLDRSSQNTLLVSHAKARARIVRAIQREMGVASGGP